MGKEGLQIVEGAPNARGAFIEDMGIDHRRLDITVAEEFLHRSDIVPAFYEVRRERMAKGMAGSAFRDGGLDHGLVNGALHRAFIHVKATLGAGGGILPPTI